MGSALVREMCALLLQASFSDWREERVDSARFCVMRLLDLVQQQQELTDWKEKAVDREAARETRRGAERREKVEKAERSTDAKLIEWKASARETADSVANAVSAGLKKRKRGEAAKNGRRKRTKRPGEMPCDVAGRLLDDLFEGADGGTSRPSSKGAADASSPKLTTATEPSLRQSVAASDSTAKTQP